VAVIEGRKLNPLSIMLKISRIESPGRKATLRLEGRVIGPWVLELRKVCEILRNSDCVVTLDLAEVEFVDRSGLELFAALRSQGVLLAQCTPFLRAQLVEEKVRPGV
jgi:hypothetical protein